jgi:hypothetical protein
MSFNPTINGFSIRKLDADMPAQNLETYDGDSIWITVGDDSGAVTTRKVVFHRPNLQFPEISHPKGNPDAELVTDLHPRLGWMYWRSCDEPHTFSVTVQQENQSTAWDTSGLAIGEHCLTDTFVVVGEELREAFPTYFQYMWYLTVTSRSGDKMTSKPGKFYIVLP